MARGRKKISLTGAVSEELKRDFNLSNFKEKKLLNQNVKTQRSNMGPPIQGLPGSNINSWNPLWVTLLY